MSEVPLYDCTSGDRGADAHTSWEELRSNRAVTPGTKALPPLHRASFLELKPAVP